MEPQKWGIYQGKPKLETVDVYIRNLGEVLNGSWLMSTPTSTTFVFDPDVNSGGQQWWSVQGLLQTARTKSNTS